MTYIQATSACPRRGRNDYLAGRALAANPYVIGTYCARLWVDGWLDAWVRSAA
jgi:hypothetical protein